MLKAPKHSDSLLTFRILPSFHPTPKGVGFPARKISKHISTPQKSPIIPTSREAIAPPGQRDFPLLPPQKGTRAALVKTASAFS